MKIIREEWSPDTLHSVVTITGKFGTTTGESQCSPDDRLYARRTLGFDIAYNRALLQYYKLKKTGLYQRYIEAKNIAERLKYHPNFDYIVLSKIVRDTKVDYILAKRQYQEKKKNLPKEIENAVNKSIEDYKFYNELKERMKEKENNEDCTS